uniref:Uncharacterized protein n=1 Tax=Oryza brachyantha TaxID=4533 RepID=J3MF49_ORYBR
MAFFEVRAMRLRLRLLFLLLLLLQRALGVAFAAGVILATGFVHMLHDAEHALSNPCLPASPWRRFPFPGFVAMLAALATLVVDFVGTHFYERKHREKAEAAAAATAQEAAAALLEDGALSGTMATAGDGEGRDGGGGGGDKRDAMHIVGIHAHAAAHRHSHAHGHGVCDGGAVHDGHAHGHGHGHGHGHEEGPSARHVVVSQILEMGIVSHSVIIGLSLGVSESPCTIKPLVAALSFHQFFEGFALGGCISEAELKNFSAFLMAFFFAITTPAGISVGAAIASFYNPNSPRALVVEGILDSMSAGILIYMALVDLIAADFLSRKMSCNPRLQMCIILVLFYPVELFQNKIQYVAILVLIADGVLHVVQKMSKFYVVLPTKTTPAQLLFFITTKYLAGSAILVKLQISIMAREARPSRKRFCLYADSIYSLAIFCARFSLHIKSGKPGAWGAYLLSTNKLELIDTKVQTILVHQVNELQGAMASDQVSNVFFVSRRVGVRLYEAMDFYR